MSFMSGLIEEFNFLRKDGPVGAGIAYLMLALVLVLGGLFGMLGERFLLAPSQCEVGTIRYGTIDGESTTMVPTGKGGFIYLHDDTDGVLLVELDSGEYADPELELTELPLYETGQRVEVCRHVGAISGIAWSWYVSE